MRTRNSDHAALRLQVAVPEPATAVAAGGFASYALGASKRLYAWGSNAQGQKGVGSWGWSGHKPEVVDHVSDGRIASVCTLDLMISRCQFPLPDVAGHCHSGTHAAAQCGSMSATHIACLLQATHAVT